MQNNLIVTKKDVVLDPFPHIMASPFLDPSFYARLKAEFPRDEIFDQNTILGGRTGRDLYAGDDLYESFMRESPAWSEFRQFIDSQDYVDWIIELFGDQLENCACRAKKQSIHYQRWIEKREILAETPGRLKRVVAKAKKRLGIEETNTGPPDEMFVRLDIAQASTGYEKVVHCDRPNRLSSMLIYFTNKEDIEMEGGDFSVHRHRKDLPITKYDRHPPKQDVETVSTMSPKENLGGVFLCCNNSYHSASAVTKSNGYREFVYISVASRARSVWRS